MFILKGSQPLAGGLPARHTTGTIGSNRFDPEGIAAPMHAKVSATYEQPPRGLPGNQSGGRLTKESM